MADGVNISPEQAAPQESPIGKAGGEAKQQGNTPTLQEKIQAEIQERQKRNDDRFWGNVQKEAEGTPTELTRDKVGTVASRAVAQAAKEGLLPDQQAAIGFWNELSKFPPGIFSFDERQKHSLELLNKLRISQGKPVAPVPPPQPPLIKSATEDTNRSKINPLNWLRKKGPEEIV